MAKAKNHPPAETPKSGRFKTGLKEFNEIVPGLPTPSAILIQGNPGSGKAKFALSLMDTPDKKDKIVVLTNNTVSEMQSEMKSFKIGLEPKFIDCYSWLSGQKAAIDTLANLNKITFLIEDELTQDSCLLFDTLTPLVLYNNEEEIERFMQQVIAIAKSKGAIIFFTLDLGTYHSDAENTLRSLCDGIINMDKDKGIRILKMRDTEVPSKDFYYELGSKGFRLRSK